MSIAPEDRAVSPLFGTVAMLAVVVCLAAVVAAGFATVGDTSSASPRAVDLSVDGDRNEVVLRHVAGDPIDATELTVTVAVDGEPLSEQPPVPFAGATGFDGAPSGPFNSRADPTWTVGETATFRVAATNDPPIEPGVEVTVSLAVDGTHLVRLEATAS